MKIKKSYQAEEKEEVDIGKLAYRRAYVDQMIRLEVSNKFSEKSSEEKELAYRGAANLLKKTEEGLAKRGQSLETYSEDQLEQTVGFIVSQVERENVADVTPLEKAQIKFFLEAKSAISKHESKTAGQKALAAKKIHVQLKALGDTLLKLNDDQRSAAKDQFVLEAFRDAANGPRNQRDLDWTVCENLTEETYSYIDENMPDLDDSKRVEVKKECARLFRLLTATHLVRGSHLHELSHKESKDLVSLYARGALNNVGRK